MSNLMLSPRWRRFRAPSPLSGPFVPDFFIAHDGSSFATGSEEDPFSLTYAGSGASGAIVPGEEGGLKDGTYLGQYVISVDGTEAEPITFRSINWGKAKIDGNVGGASTASAILRIDSDNVRLWGTQVLNSDPIRVSDGLPDTSNPDDMNWRAFKSLRVTGSNVKTIHNVIHDTANGIEDQSELTAEGNEHHCNLIYCNGWIDALRGHGHGFYVQNAGLQKVLKNNVVFNSYQTGLKIGGDSANLVHFLLQRNALFMAGAPLIIGDGGFSYGYARNLDIQGGVAIGDITIDRNSLYHINGQSESWNLGSASASVPALPFTITNNINHGLLYVNYNIDTFTGNKQASRTAFDASGSRMVLVRVPTGKGNADYIWDSNAYSYNPASTVGALFRSIGGVNTTYTTLAAWQAATTWDANSTFTSDPFTGSDIVYCPSDYEPGFGFVHVFNWNGASSVAVDPATILNIGDSYLIRSVYDVLGEMGQTEYTGTYSGSPILLDMGGWISPSPIGGPACASAAPYFMAFLVRKT